MAVNKPDGQKKKIESDIDALNSEARSLFNKLDFKQASELSDKAYKIAFKQKYQRGIAEALLIKGNLFSSQQENLQARTVLMQAYSIIEHIGDKELLSSVYSSLGITYGQLSLCEECIMYFTKALEASKSTKNERLIAIDYINLAHALDMFDNDLQAISFYNKAMTCAKKLSDEKLQTTILTDLSAVYRSKGDYEIALKNGFDALEMAEKINDTRSIITIYHYISACFMGLKRFDEAEYYAKLCLNLATENNVTTMIIWTELVRAEINLLQEKYMEAKDILNNFDNISSFIDNVEAIYQYYDLLLNVYEATADYKNAYAKLKELMDFKLKQAEIKLKAKLDVQEQEFILNESTPKS